nr:metallophosphoesterase family protein [Motiliproteus sediminis]
MPQARGLGVIDGPLLFFGGPYSNLQATLAIKAVAERLAIPPQQVICTGDVVAYCADPEATVALIREWGIEVVMGNCEQSLASDADDCGCGFEQGSTCDLLSGQWYPFARRRLSADARAWMAGLPAALTLEFAGRSLRVVHGGVEQINRFLFQSTAIDVLAAEWDRSGADWVVSGHAGIPFGRAIATGGWLNAGVIGMPANDGSSDGWYMLLQHGATGPQASWHRMRYDATAAAERMAACSLAPAYASALVSGCWPSQDVLPAEEAALCGKPLSVPVMSL